MKQLTFKTVCEQIDKETKINDTCDDLKILFGAVSLFLGNPAGFGEAVDLFLKALDIGEELVKVGERVLEKIVGSKTNECDKRMNQMRWAYSIIYYTAFFDVLDESLPKEIRKKIALTVKEKKDIFLDTLLRDKKFGDFLAADGEIQFPSVMYDYADVEKTLREFYTGMSQRVLSFVHMLSFEEEGTEAEIIAFHSEINKLPKLALERFKAQYLHLASNYNEFYVYMRLADENIQREQLEVKYQNLVSIGCSIEEKIDVGFADLGEMFQKLPGQIHEQKVKSIVQSMIETYQREIGRTVLEISEEERRQEKIQYPSICDAFVPQAYKLIEYTGREQLEKKETWEIQEIQGNMDSFWAKYCVTPDSLESLLLILGEPGGGKSLLTKMICGRMINENDIFIRIPLREVDVENDIETIVCRRIEKDGDASEPLHTFKWFAESFQSNPITLIFDGYDEVLQATGGEYRNFLTKIAKFQKDCWEKHRPVRIVVTSRATLIDKAEIPVNTIVMKLLEFDEKRREKWIEIWNQKNAAVFQNEKIHPFVLPQNNKSVDELSRQPLLLLMLAIYDANIEDGVNSLAQEEMLNRTQLYNELLRRFIKRELKKGARGEEDSYEDSAEEDRERMIECEMDKLGIAALGMFNRGKLSLRVTELQKDLAYMEAETPEYKKAGKMLSEAELFFGSFFFIHDSKTGTDSNVSKAEAFEFLHKTFYEFLVADFVLKSLIRKLDELDAIKCSRIKNGYHDALKNPDYLGKQCYAALIYAQLCKEADMIQMMSEWKESLVEKYFQGEREDLDRTFEELFDKQIQFVREKELTPEVWKEHVFLREDEKDWKEMSYLQHCATYLLNLLTVKTIMCSYQESRMKLEDWKYMAQFWKMNIPEDVILKFMILFGVQREGESVCVKKEIVISEDEKKDCQEIHRDLSHFLQDDITYHMCILQDERLTNRKKQYSRRRLLVCGIDTRFEVLLGELKQMVLSDKWDAQRLERNIRDGYHALLGSEIDCAIVLNWLMYIRLLTEKYDFQISDKEIISEFPKMVFRKYKDELEIVMEFLKISQKIIPDIRIRQQFESDYLVQWLYEKPNLFLEYVQRTNGFVPNEPLAYGFYGSFQMIYDQDKVSAIELFELFYGYGDVTSDFHSILEWLWDRRNEIYDASPMAMIRLLKIFMMIHREDRAIEFLQSNDDRILEMIHTQPMVSVELLEILRKTHVKSEYADSVSACILSGFEEIFYEFPEEMIRLVKVITASEDYVFYSDIITEMLRKFDMPFHLAPKEAVSMLRMLHNQGKGSYQAIVHVLRNFEVLLEDSVDAAVSLIYLYKRVNYSHQTVNIVACIRTCFEYMIHNDSAIDSGMMIGLLKKLDSKEVQELKGYFERRIKYIEEKYPVLAKKIESLYVK